MATDPEFRDNDRDWSGAPRSRKAYLVSQCDHHSGLLESSRRKLIEEFDLDYDARNGDVVEVVDGEEES